MIGAMLMMLQLCTKIRRESDMSARKRSFLGKCKQHLLEQNKMGCRATYSIKFAHECPLIR